eukprot:10481192-Heterocapsa_arctica.AAC.1
MDTNRNQARGLRSQTSILNRIVSRARKTKESRMAHRQLRQYIPKDEWMLARSTAKHRSLQAGEGNVHTYVQPIADNK